MARGGNYRPEDFGLDPAMLEPVEERQAAAERIQAVNERAQSLVDTVLESPATKRTKRMAVEQRILPLVLEGRSYDEIADELELTTGRVAHVVQESLRTTRSQDVETLRAIENGRLDRAQAAIWDDVKHGDLKAVQTFLQISKRRSQLNGLDAPIRVEMSVDVRENLVSALEELEQVLEAPENVEDAEIVQEGPQQITDGSEGGYGVSLSDLNITTMAAEATYTREGDDD